MATPFSVLVIDASPDQRESLAALGTSLAYCTSCAATGTDGFRIAEEHEPDAVVLGLQLPDIPGEKIARRLKTLPKPPYVIIFTGSAARKADALAGGCDAFLLKPHTDPLLALLAKLATGHRPST